MGTIKDLYYGNISPCEKSFKDSKDFLELQKSVVKSDDEFCRTLNDRQKELFEKYKIAFDEMCNYFEESAFTDGFILGMRLAVESIWESDNNE